MHHLGELVEVLSPYFSSRTSQECLDALEAAGVPAGPVASVGEMLEHPQTLAREMVVSVKHTRLGPVRSIGSPLKMSGAPSGPERSGAPLLGEHTCAVLGEAGYREEEIDKLLESGVAFAR